eukprot:CAMPEP_0116890232 /NCGR_PEP_ID=MMETSP0467-20121206/767_1 /TAXON_ID=283647 /ORGANISM="Mesodinium pulex, Strain SPMC105" /LENGTH=115 /DNA_ID=CAMNT_0004557779 /DNA_START=1615 /DNA_END=1962 /DNA_ORIENTATION=-
MNKKIIGKHKFSKEEKDELQQKELDRKDEYALNNLGGYKRIYPSEDFDTNTHYTYILNTIREMNNVYMKKKPKKDEDPKKIPKKKVETKTTDTKVEEEKKPAKTKEEIQSIVDRL